MQFGWEQPDVYRVSIRDLASAYETAERVRGIDCYPLDQRLRASQSICFDIAEGKGTGTNADRPRYFEIARGPALGCGPIQGCRQRADR